MKYLPAANVKVVAALRLLELRNYSQRGNVINLRSCIPKMFVGNGLDRSGISVFTARLYEIRIEYNTMRLEAEQASQFPTPTLHSPLLTLHS